VDRFFSWIGSVITALREGFSELTVGSAMALVAFSSGFISYTHISALTLAEGQSWKTAHLMPACIDGQIVIGSFYFMDGKNNWQKTAGLVLGVVPGIAESLFANWESGIVHGLLAAGWATVPAQAFACSTFLFERWLHNRRKERPATVAARQLAPVFSPVSVLSVLHPAPQVAPRGVVNPAEPQKKAASPATRFAGFDPRLPLPEGEELERAVTTLSRNEMFRKYQVTKHKADQLRKQFGVGRQDSEEEASRAA